MTRFTPGVLSFYRGKAGHSSAIQFKLVPPSFEREGCLLVDMTNGPGPFTYDWKNKLSFKLSYQEVSAIANWRNQPLKFKHDPNAKREGAGQITKTLEIKPGKQGGVFVDLVTWKDQAKDKAHAIALHDDELYAIRKLCDRALTIIIGCEPEYLLPPRPMTQPVAQPTHPSHPPQPSRSTETRPTSPTAARPQTVPPTRPAAPPPSRPGATSSSVPRPTPSSPARPMGAQPPAPSRPTAVKPGPSTPLM